MGGADDEAIVARATELGRVVFTRDEDFLAIASDIQASGRRFSGVIYAHQLRLSIGDCIWELGFIDAASESNEYINRVEYLLL